MYKRGQFIQQTRASKEKLLLKSSVGGFFFQLSLVNLWFQSRNGYSFRCYKARIQILGTKCHNLLLPLPGGQDIQCVHWSFCHHNYSKSNERNFKTLLTWVGPGHSAIIITPKVMKGILRHY